MITRPIVAVTLACALTVHAGPPRFIAHEIATGLRGGYQVVAADLNRDGKPDLIAVASNLPDLVWYENPTWTPHVIAGGFTGLINVAVADLDGDGIPEIAVAHAFSTRPDQSAGIVSLLTHGANPADRWTMREIDRAPSAHRLRWFTTATGAKWLINAPLAGSTSQPPDYKGATPIYYYRPPEWKRELVSAEEQGVVHAIEPIKWSDASGTELYSAGFLGIHAYRFANGQWSRALIADGDAAAWPKSGSSDVAIGRLGRDRFVAAIEPWHGNQVIVYRERSAQWAREVIDTGVVDGHTLVTVDLDRDGRDEVVLGQRGGTRSVWIYANSASDQKWTRTTLDEGGMAAAGCTAADLNGDGRTDIACIGTATANLKWYENTGAR
jgi:hypothetical protein